MPASAAARRFGQVFHNVAVGLLCGLLAAVQSIGLASLLGLDAALSTVGVGMALTATTVAAAVIPLLSSAPGTIAVTQGVVIVALAGVVGPVATAVAGKPPDVVLATVVAAVAVSTLAIGALSFAIGTFRLGRFIRFLPFPVVAGFLAGSGWLILHGGIDLIAGGSALANPALFANAAALVRVLAAALFLAAVVVLMVRTQNRFALPLAVGVALVAFNTLAWMGGLDETLRADGWLLALPDRALWPPITAGEISGIDWPAIAGGMLQLPAAATLTVIALLMNVTGIELDARRDVQLDRELKAVGIANLIAGAGGALPAFHSLSLTLMATRLGAHGRLAGLTVAAVCLVALVLGNAVMAMVPKPLLAALLVWIGAGLMTEWLVRSWSRLPSWEYAIIVLIFAVIAAFGFAWGIFVGLIAAVLLFAVEYGRVDIVRLIATGRDFQSSIDMSEERRQTLAAHGEAILVIRLQGFLFFGTADRLRQRIEERVLTGEPGNMRFVIIDFRRVSGLDSSTVLSFVRLTRVAARERFTVVLTGLSPGAERRLARGGLDGSAIRFMADFDAAVKWCEDALLGERAPLTMVMQNRPLAERLAAILSNPQLAAEMLPYCERVTVADGDALIEQGMPSDDIFFIESGHAAVVMASAGAAAIRLATIGPGAIVGEIAFYLGEARSASVVAEGPLTAWRISRVGMARLQEEKPDAAFGFHEGMARMLAKRLTRTNHLVRLLAD